MEKIRHQVAPLIYIVYRVPSVKDTNFALTAFVPKEEKVASRKERASPSEVWRVRLLASQLGQRTFISQFRHLVGHHR